MATKKAKAKSAVTDDTKRVKCPDCGLDYTAGAPHVMFCEAHTCSECGTSFNEVLPVYDSRETPAIRYCDDCLEEHADD